jgi:hypothetical protein
MVSHTPNHRRRANQQLHQTNLGKNALSGQEFSRQADHETQHRQTSVPSFCELSKANFRRFLSHD